MGKAWCRLMNLKKWSRPGKWCMSGDDVAKPTQLFLSHTCGSQEYGRRGDGLRQGGKDAQGMRKFISVYTIPPQGCLLRVCSNFPAGVVSLPQGCGFPGVDPPAAAGDAGALVPRGANKIVYFATAGEKVWVWGVGGVGVGLSVF